MQLTHHHKNRFTFGFVLLFYVLAVIKWLQGLWLYQYAPFLFTTRFDGVTWLLMLTGFHKWLIDAPALRVAADLAFYAMPALFLWVYLRRPTKTPLVAGIWLLVNWIYVQAYTLFPTNSIEAHIAWLLMPVCFCTRNLKSFYFLLRGLRYFFLYFFLSAGIWKLVNGGAFEPGQMSAILLEQHKDLLATSGNSWQASFIYFFIAMPLLSFALYWTALLIELFFAAGFFTRRYDRLLLALFLLFLLFDYLVMRIPYWEVSPFLLTLWFGHLEEPVIKKELTAENADVIPVQNRVA